MTALALQTLYQIIIMLMIILVGIFSYKINLISKETNEKLSNLVLMLINPIVIFVSYQRDFDPTLLKGLMISLVLALITHIMAILISYVLLWKNKKEADHAIEQFSIVYSNCGFIGIPLVNGILGSVGVFYLTAYMTIFNLFIWTHGVIVMTGRNDKKTLISAFRSPTIIATIAGFVLFVARLTVPDIIVEALAYIGNMNTPMAMLVAGVTIAQMDLRKMFTKPYNYYITFIKLLVVPLLMLFLYQFFDISKEVLLTTILATACPVGATISLFAIRYKKNYIYASEIFALTTLLCVITIPFVMFIAGLLIN